MWVKVESWRARGGVAGWNSRGPAPPLLYLFLQQLFGYSISSPAVVEIRWKISFTPRSSWLCGIAGQRNNPPSRSLIHIGHPLCFISFYSFFFSLFGRAGWLCWDLFLIQPEWQCWTARVATLPPYVLPWVANPGTEPPNAVASRAAGPPRRTFFPPDPWILIFTHKNKNKIQTRRFNEKFECGIHN